MMNETKRNETNTRIDKRIESNKIPTLFNFFLCLDLITRRELEWNVQNDRLVLFIITLYTVYIEIANILFLFN